MQDRMPALFLYLVDLWIEATVKRPFVSLWYPQNIKILYSVVRHSSLVSAGRVLSHQALPNRRALRYLYLSSDPLLQAMNTMGQLSLFAGGRG